MPARGDGLSKTAGHKRALLRKVTAPLLLAAAAGALWLALGCRETRGTEHAYNALVDANGGTAPQLSCDDEGNLDFVLGRFTGRTVKDENDAARAIADTSALAGVEDVGQRLAFSRKDVAEGVSFYRFEQRCEGLRVYGRDVIVAVDGSGSARAMSGALFAGSGIGTSPKVQPDGLDLTAGVEAYRDTAELVVYPVSNDSGELGWQVTTPSNVYVYSAVTGELLRDSELATYATRRREMRGCVSADGSLSFDAWFEGESGPYVSEDLDRNIHVLDAACHEVNHGNETYSDRIYEKDCPVVTDDDGIWERGDASRALAHVEAAYDAYARMGWKGYDGKNGYLKVFIRIGRQDGTNTNACANPGGFLQFNSDNGISRECALHEYSHLVQRTICDLAEGGDDGGAIMEAYADVMAIAIDENGTWSYDGNCRNIANPADLSTSEEGPHATSYLERDESKGAWVPGGEEHHNSTAISHAAYLMHESGISFPRLRSLWFISMFLLNHNADAHTCRSAVVAAAALLDFDPAEVRAIEDAFDQVGIGRTGYVLSPEATVAVKNANGTDCKRFELSVCDFSRVVGGEYEEWKGNTSSGTIRLDSLEQRRSPWLRVAEGLYVMRVRVEASSSSSYVTRYLQVSPDGDDRAEIWLDFSIETVSIPAKINHYYSGNDMTASSFILTWYDDWSFDGSSVIENEIPQLDRCLPLIDEKSSLYREFQGANYSKEAYGGNLSVDTCVIGEPSVEKVSDDTYRVSIWYTTKQESNWSESVGYEWLMESRRHEASWNVTVNNEGKVTGLSLQPRGPYTLSGTVHVHDEDYFGEQVSVTSITLDDPFGYLYEYKMTVEAEANIVALETSNSSGYGNWLQYDGQHIVVECEGLQGAIEGTSYYRVDTLATGSIRLVSGDEAGKQTSEADNPKQPTGQGSSIVPSNFDNKDYWIVFKEGYRSGRVEASSFDVTSGSPTLVWDKNVTISGATLDGKVSQFYLTEAGDWEKMGEYGIPTDWALEILASNVPIVDSAGNRIDVPESY